MVIKHLENKIRLVGIICTAFLAGCIIISVSSIWTARRGKLEFIGGFYTN